MRLVFAAALSLLIGCSGVDEHGLSPQYQQNGREAYELLRSGVSGAAVSRHDIDVAIARARSREANVKDQQAQKVLESLYAQATTTECSALLPSVECTPVERAALEACEAEAAKYFSQEGMPLDSDYKRMKEPAYGDCSKASFAASEQMVKEMGEQQVADPIKCKDWGNGLKPQYRNSRCPYTVAKSRAEYEEAASKAAESTPPASH